jgi:YVTN family beta-propeller protein
VTVSFRFPAFGLMAGMFALTGMLCVPAVAQAPAKPAASAASAAAAPKPVQAAAAMTHPVFVLNSLDASVSVIDPVTWKETRRIPTGKEPHHLYLTPDEKSVIVANALGPIR